MVTSTIKEVLYDASLTIARLQRNIRACQFERNRGKLCAIYNDLCATEIVTSLAQNSLAKMDMDCKVFNVKIKETKHDTHQL